MENYEEKYKQALEKCKKEFNFSNLAYSHEEIKQKLEYIFPELKKSEDERIREEILNCFVEMKRQGCFPSKHKEQYDSWIAWLEKQGEPQDKGEISDGYHTFNELYYYRMLYNAAFFNMLPKEWVHKSKKHNDGEECFGGGWFIVMANLPTGQISNHYELKDWNLFQIPEKEVADKWDGHTPQEAATRLHKYLCKQKPNDKIKPKFKIGDWITFYGSPAFKILKIEVEDNGILDYLLLNQNGHDSFYNKEYVDENARLWTIQDAKDGDILTTHLSPEGAWIGIFKERTGDSFTSYCFLASDGEFVTNINRCKQHGTQGIHPATKEQRDLLSQKIEEAGYKWNNNKKELIKHGQ